MKRKNYFMVATPMLFFLFCTLFFICYLVLKQKIAIYWLFSLVFILLFFYKRIYEIEVANRCLKIYKRLFWLRCYENKINITNITIIRRHVSSDGFSGYGVGGYLRTTDNYKLVFYNKETDEIFEEYGSLERLNETAFFISNALSIKIEKRTVNIDNTDR